MRRAEIIRATNDVHIYPGEMRCDQSVECCIHEQTTLKLQVTQAQAINLPVGTVLSRHHNCANFCHTAITSNKIRPLSRSPKLGPIVSLTGKQGKKT